MSHVARDTAVAPRALVRALAVCFFAALWLLVSQVAADAGPRDDAADSRISQVARDAVASTQGAADAREPAETVGKTVRDAARDVEDSVEGTVAPVDEARDRVTDEAVRTVDGVARDTRETADDATAKVRDVVRHTTDQVAEVVEQAPQPVPPAPAPNPDPSGDADRADERPAKAVSVHESLVTQENPALLVVPTTPAFTLSDAAALALSSTAVEALSGPVPAPAPVPGDASGNAPDGALPAHGGTGQSVPAPALAGYLRDVVTAAPLDLVQGPLERALVPPADRATSPGTTPD